MKHATALALAFALVIGAFAAAAPQDTTAGSSTKKKAVAKTAAPSVSTQLSEMKRAIDAQQQQILQLMNQRTESGCGDPAVAAAGGPSPECGEPAAQKADTAASQVAQQQQDVAAVKSDVTDLKQNATNAALSLQETQKNVKDAMESPLAIHYKGDHDYSGRLRRGRNCVAFACAWRRHQHTVQFDSVRWFSGESHVGILWVRPPVSSFVAGPGQSG